MPTQNTVRKAVIPAAGFGTRQQPFTNYIPKELLPVGRKPVLGYVLDELQCAGIQDVLFIVSEKTKQSGSGDAILYAEEWVAGESFVVAFGDSIIEAPEQGSAPLHRLLHTFEQQSAGAAILVEQIAREKVFRYGVVDPLEPKREYTKPFALRTIVEKPKVEEAPSNLVIAARFALNPVIFDTLRETPKDVRGELNLPDAICRLGEAGMPLWAVPIMQNEARRDIGNFETYFANFVRYALRDPEYGASIQKIVDLEAHK
ncbi:MAG: sugar phosphate nucleotidyltransferase [Armatimonadetes bacterium]|nr:sugar phosphate nucleotidyltransferase [Armatimonadota bacterium]